MREFQQKKKRRNIMYSPVSAVLFVILLSLLVGSLFDLWNKKRRVDTLLREAQYELAKTEQKKQSVESELERIGNGRGEETFLREKYNIAAEGESVILVVDGEQDDSFVPVVHRTFSERLSIFWAGVKSAF